MRLLLSDSFMRSLADLDPADARRVVAFVDKLLAAPSSSSLRPEIVHDAADRRVKSFKVTHDLRAIALVDGSELMLLFASRHDKAYAWARDHCIECHPIAGDRITRRGDADEGRPLIATSCGGRTELCEVLDRHGIEHDLGSETGH